MNNIKTNFKKNLTRLEILLYEAIEDSDNFVHSAKEMADMLGCTVASVNRTYRELIMKDLIKLVEFGHKPLDKRVVTYKFVVK